LALRWKNIDLDFASMYIIETVHQLKTGEYVFSDPKSKRGKRNIALSPSVAILLREYKAEQTRNRQLLGGHATHLTFSLVLTSYYFMCLTSQLLQLSSQVNDK
jgi:integrase